MLSLCVYYETGYTKQTDSICLPLFPPLFASFVFSHQDFEFISLLSIKNLTYAVVCLLVQSVELRFHLVLDLVPLFYGIV